MKIKVIDEDIKNGEPGNCKSCAISQALKRYFKTNETYTEIDDATGDVLLTVNNEKYVVNQKDENDVLFFISDFDMLGCDPHGYPEPDPIEFTINQQASEQKG